MSTLKSRRNIFQSTFAIASLGLLSVLTLPVAAQSWPTKPVKVVVPAPAGSSLDVIVRGLGETLSKRWGQPLVVDNKPGAGGTIGTGYVARADADGSVMVMAAASHNIAGSLYNKLTYDPQKDFAPLAHIGSASYVLMVHPDVPAKTAAEYIRYAKANPGKLTFASSGSGTSVHLSAVLFEKMAKIDMIHVPYKGTGSAMPDVISGQVDMSFPNLPSAVPQVKAGNLRGLGVTTAKRSAAAPGIPTIAESGLPGYDMATWYGLVAPANLPVEIRNRLNKELQSILADPKFKDKLIAQGADPMPGSPEQFSAFIKSEIEKWRKLIAQSQITVD